MKHARFIAAARQEFLAEVAYYNEAQPGLGSRFAAAIEEASARALAFPLAGSPSVSNTRRVILKGFPFSLFYRPEGDGISFLPFHIMRAVPATGQTAHVIASRADLREKPRRPLTSTLGLSFRATAPLTMCSPVATVRYAGNSQD